MNRWFIFLLASAGLFLATPISAQQTDPLAEMLKPFLRPSVEIMLEHVRSDHRYSNESFPMAPEAFEKFRRDWIESFIRQTGLTDWVVRDPSGKRSPIAGRFKDQLVDTIDHHGVTMEIHAVTIQPSQLVVPIVLCLPNDLDKNPEPAPGVCVFSGHTQHGLHDIVVDLDSYQQGVGVRLARAGIASIAVEKIDTGYLSRDGHTGVDETEAATLLLGSAAVLRAHQLRACLAASEILACHPRVDESRIGATGVSLGGWLSVQTALLSDRIRAVADFGRKTRTLSTDLTAETYKGQTDLCHIIPGMLQLGDRNLYPIALAPLPMLAGHGEKDAGSQRNHAAHFRNPGENQYAALGAEENYHYLIHGGGDTMPSKEVITWFREVFSDR